MDHVTPARIWAIRESPDSADHDHHHDRFLLRRARIAMGFTVLGPFIGLIAAIVLLWHRGGAHGVGWTQIITMAVMYALTGFGVTIGFHRLLTHKSFETYRPIRWMLAILGSSAFQGMTIRWCATHRRHHQKADLEGDPHSPHLHGEGFMNMLAGMWHAHLGWVWDKDKPDLARSVPDLLADPVLMRIDQLYFLWVALGLLIPAVILGLFYHSWAGFFSGLLWGGLVRACLMQHVTWSVNSVCHVWGERPFKNTDFSTNNFPVAILSLGEGWHNNHHAFPTSARHGLRWWQFDSTWLVIRLMKLTGLAWNVRVPSESAKNARSAMRLPTPIPLACAKDNSNHEPTAAPACSLQ